jgi:hypothetical protein
MVPLEIGAVTPSDGPLRGTRRSSPCPRELAAGFEAMLLQAAFAPLAKAIGFYGETVVGIATQSILRDGAGLTPAFERALPPERFR